MNYNVCMFDIKPFWSETSAQQRTVVLTYGIFFILVPIPTTRGSVPKVVYGAANGAQVPLFSYAMVHK